MKALIRGYMCVQAKGSKERAILRIDVGRHAGRRRTLTLKRSYAMMYYSNANKRGEKTNLFSTRTSKVQRSLFADATSTFNPFRHWHTGHGQSAGPKNPVENKWFFIRKIHRIAPFPLPFMDLRNLKACTSHSFSPNNPLVPTRDRLGMHVAYARYSMARPPTTETGVLGVWLGKGIHTHRKPCLKCP